MGRRCQVCDHPQRAAIERALLLGKSITGIASDFGLSRKSVGRHKRNHLKAVLPALPSLGDIEAQPSTYQSLVDLAQKSQDALRLVHVRFTEAFETNDTKTLLQASGPLAKLLEVAGKYVAAVAKVSADLQAQVAEKQALSEAENTAISRLRAEIKRKADRIYGTNTQDGAGDGMPTGAD